VPRCCQKPMKKQRDTITKIERFKCLICGAHTYVNAIESIALNVDVEQDKRLSTYTNKNILAHLDARYITGLKYQNKKLLATPDEELPLQRRRRKRSVQTILGYWDRIKEARKCQNSKTGSKKKSKRQKKKS